MAAHFPAPRSKSFSSPHQLRDESTTPSGTEQVKRHQSLALSSNTRRRCLWMTLVRAKFQEARRDGSSTGQGEDVGPPCPRMLRCRCLRRFESSIWMVQTLGNPLRDSGYEPLRGRGKRVPFLPTDSGARMN